MLIGRKQRIFRSGFIWIDCYVATTCYAKNYAILCGYRKIESMYMRFDILIVKIDIS